jgi:hypothetical protein
MKTIKAFIIGIGSGFWAMQLSCGAIADTEELSKTSIIKAAQTSQHITVIDEKGDSSVLISALSNTVKARIRYEATATKNPFCYDYDFGGSPYNPIPSPFPRSSIKYYDETIQADAVTENSVTFNIGLEIGACKYQPQFMYLNLDKDSAFYVKSRSLQINFDATEPLDSYTGVCELLDDSKFYCHDLSVFPHGMETIISTEWL